MLTVFSLHFIKFEFWLSDDLFFNNRNLKKKLIQDNLIILLPLYLIMNLPHLEEFVATGNGIIGIPKYFIRNNPKLKIFEF